MSATLIVGDLHLGKNLGMGRPAIGSQINGRVADQFHLLEWILDQAIENNATNIIFTGDICEDVKPDYYLISHFIQWLKKCEQYTIDIHIIAGNHDIKRSGNFYTSALDVIQSAEVHNTRIYKQIDTIYNGTVGFTLLPFRDRRSFNLDSATEALERIKTLLSYETADIPGQYDKVLIGHLAHEGSIIVGDEFDDAANELMCPQDMFSNYDYVWMGHVHKPQVMKKQNPHIAHIGSLDISDIGETEHQKILILFDSKIESKFKTIPVPSRPVKMIKVSVESNEDTTQKILDALEPLDLTGAIFRIDVALHGREAPNADRQSITDTVYRKGAHYLYSFTETRTTVVVPQEKRRDLDNTIEPWAAVKMWALEKIPDEDRDSFNKMAMEIIKG